MLLVYSILLAIGFVLMSPLFLLRREKYAAGFKQRLGNHPEFPQDNRQVIWLHCVSVGETNAARPLVDRLIEDFPEHRLVFSTTTKTAQELAQRIFADKAAAIIYFPFDWRFSVHRALERYRPALVMLMETEIWPRFIREAKLMGAKIAIINGRLSKKSFSRYSRIRPFVSRVLTNVDLALMQTQPDADRIVSLGMDENSVSVIGNLKFEQGSSSMDSELTEYLRTRFAIHSAKPLIIASSTHEPEERHVIKSLKGELGHSCRLMIAPRHPERFEAVSKSLRELPYKFVCRSSAESQEDHNADIILLDTIGELRAAYPLAEIVIVGGSLIPHGGQSVLEPAVEGKAIVTGPYTFNFEAVIEEFKTNDAIVQTPKVPDDSQTIALLSQTFRDLLEKPERRAELGQNAAAVMNRSGRDVTARTIERIRQLMLRNH